MKSLGRTKVSSAGQFGNRSKRLSANERTNDDLGKDKATKSYVERLIISRVCYFSPAYDRRVYDRVYPFGHTRKYVVGLNHWTLTRDRVGESREKKNSLVGHESRHQSNVPDQILSARLNSRFRAL